jgi:PII-like signaling protein
VIEVQSVGGKVANLQNDIPVVGLVISREEILNKHRSQVQQSIMLFALSVLV